MEHTLRPKQITKVARCYVNESLFNFVTIEGSVNFHLGSLAPLEKNAIVDSLNRGYFWGFGNESWFRYMAICDIFGIPANGVSTHSWNGLTAVGVEARAKLQDRIHTIWNMIDDLAVAKQAGYTDNTWVSSRRKEYATLANYEHSPNIVTFRRPRGLKKHAFARFIEDCLPPRDEAHFLAARKAVTDGLRLTLQWRNSSWAPK